jgi:hypothetical protein
MQKSQDAFSKIDSDTHPSNIKSLGGDCRLIRNGKIFNNGSGNFKFVSDDGTKHVFTIPFVPAEEIAEKPNIAHIYPIIGIKTGYVESIIGPDVTSADGRRFGIGFYKNTTLVGTIHVYCRQDASNQCRVRVDFVNFGGYSNTGASFALSLAGGLSVERRICEHVVARYNALVSTIDKQGIVLTAKKHGTMEGQSNIIPELLHNDPAFTDYTWYLEAKLAENTNFNIDCFPIGTTDKGTINIYGWGQGSEHGSSSKFPVSAPFYTPGKDEIWKTYSETKPQGSAVYLKHDTYYYVKSGSYIKSDESTRYLTNTWDGAEFNISTPDGIKAPGSILVIPSGSSFTYSPYVENSELIECSPQTYAYTKHIQTYSASYVKKPIPVEIHEFIKVSFNIALAFCIAGNDEEVLIYKIDFNNNANPVLTKLIHTTENIDFSINNQIKNIHIRYESDNNIFVYWSAKSGHLRSFNISEPPTTDIDFNTRVYKPINFGKVFVSNVHRSGGSLLVGAYQFAYELSIDGVNWSKTSTHTNAIHIGSARENIETINEESETTTYPTPVSEKNRGYKGFPAGTKTTQSIEVKITDIDRRYNFVRIYSIEAISGSGQYGSAVVNVIHEGELKNKDYYEFIKTYTGVIDVVRGGLNISEITKPFIVPINIKSFCFNSNRLVIAGYEEQYPVLSDTEKLNVIGGNIVNVKAAQFIGSDQIGTTGTIPKGHKSWFNQQWYKSQQIGESYEYAWVFIDEYGNYSDPLPAFFTNHEFKQNSDSQNWFDFISQIGNDHDHYTTGQTPNIRQDQSAFAFWMFGSAVRMSGSFPSWAKKAKLVRKQKSNLRDERYWCLIDTLASESERKLVFAPDMLGFNSFKKDYPANGDRINYYVSYSSQRDMLRYIDYNGAKYALVRTPYAMEAEDITPKIVWFDASTEEIASLYTKDVNGAERTIIFFKTKEDLSLFSRTYMAQIIKKEQPSTEIGLINYEDTGHEIDLTYKYDSKYQGFFGGDCYAGTVMKPIAYPITYDQNTSATDASVWFWQMPVLSRMNYAMGNEGWFITNGEFDPDYNKLTINRDYSISNSWLKFVLIKDNFLKLTTVFNNTLIYTLPKEINSKFNPFGKLLSNNIVDMQGNLGAITAVEDTFGLLYVFFERGVMVLFPNDKELLQTTAGTKVAVGDGSYLTSREESTSETKGTTDRVLRTDYGVYFIDPYTDSFCITDGQKPPIDLSLMASFKTIFSIGISNEVNKNKHIGYWMNYNNQNNEVYITVSNKTEDESEVILSGGFFWVKALNKNLIIGDVVIVNGSGFKLIGTIKELGTVSGFLCYKIETDPITFRASFIFGSSIISFAPCIISKATFDILTFHYDETLKLFENVSDKASIGSQFLQENQAHVPLHNKAEIVYETSEETTLYKNTEPLPSFGYSDPYQAFIFSTSGAVAIATFNPISFTLSDGPITKANVSGIASSVPNGFLIMVTKKDFLFKKYYKYKIVADLTISSSASGEIALQPHKIFEPYMTVISEENYDVASGLKEITFEFEALENFESPLCLYQKVGSGSGFTAIVLNIKEMSAICEPQCELHVVLNSTKGALESGVVNVNSDQFVYDNGVIAADTVEPDLTVNVMGAQQNEDTIVTQELVKKRLNEYRFAVPYFQSSRGKERVRGVFIIVKYKFTNYFKKFAVHSVKHIYRKSS